MPWSLLISFIVNFINKWLASKRAEQALRELGARTEATAAKAQAEKQEATAHTAGAAVTNTPQDDADPFLRKD